MENLVRIKYFEGLNQISIIDEIYLRKKVPSLEEMSRTFSSYVEEVFGEDGAGVQIGVSFTNVLFNHIYLGKNGRFRNFHFMFWPMHGEVTYEFRKGEFFIKEGDPTIILDSLVGIAHPSFNARLFFLRNPYKNPPEDKNISYFFPDITGDFYFI